MILLVLPSGWLSSVLLLHAEKRTSPSLSAIVTHGSLGSSDLREKKAQHWGLVVNERAEVSQIKVI